MDGVVCMQSRYMRVYKTGFGAVMLVKMATISVCGACLLLNNGFKFVH